MAKTSKSTKKFQKKHLKKTILKRKRSKRVLNKKSKNITSVPDEKSKDLGKNTVEEFLNEKIKISKKKNVKKESDESGSSSETFEKDLSEENDEESDFHFDDLEDDEKFTDEKITNKKETEITVKIINTWEKELEDPKIELIKTIVKSFKSIIETESSDSENNFKCDDPETFLKLVFFVLKKLPDAVKKLTKFEKKEHEQKEKNKKIDLSDNSTNKLISILKLHVKSLIYLLKDVKDADTVTLILFSIKVFFPFILSDKKTLKNVLKSVSNKWAFSLKAEIQMVSFSFLLKLVDDYPDLFLETILKTTYQSFLQICSKTDAYNISRINFCKNTCSKLFNINKKISYQTGFEALRLLAIHLRSSLNSTADINDRCKDVYCWQFFHSLDFWSRVISYEFETKKKNVQTEDLVLKELIYPLTQIALGTINLAPMSKFFPMRFHIIRLLTDLSRKTFVFIPLSSLLLHVLTSSLIKNPAKTSSLKSFDFEYNIKASSNYLNSKIYQDGVIVQLLELISEYFGLYSNHIAFPELVTPTILSIKRFTKHSKNFNFNKQLNRLNAIFIENSNFILEKRSKIDFGPTEKKEIELFHMNIDWAQTPLGKHIISTREFKKQKDDLIKNSLNNENSESK